MKTTNRDPKYQLQSYPQYLQARGMIKNNTFSLYKNFKGGNSVLKIGFQDSKMSFNNYSLFEIPGQNLSLYTFEAHQVRVGNFTFNETELFIKTVPAIVDNHFPYLLLQTTSPEAGDYFISNMTDNFEGILFRQYDGINNSVQAYFPLTDCADVAIQFKDKSLEFKTDANYLHKLNQGIFKLEGENCVSQMVLLYNSTVNMIVLGKPLFANANISINYDIGQIGFSNGVNLNPTPVNYTPRVIILFVSFGLISLSLGLLGRLFNNN